jgi:DNA polymerase alpha subunit B
VRSGDSAVKSLEQSFSQVTGVAYQQRTGSGNVVTQYNQEKGDRGLVDPSDRRPYGLRCDIYQSSEDEFENIKHRYRFMFTPLNERSYMLESMLLRLQPDLCKVAQISVDDLHPVGVPSQDPIWVCGRIYNESVEGKLNRSSVILEGSLSLSRGRRIALEFPSEESGVSFSLFPGQIVLLYGVNSSGRRMTVKRVVDDTQLVPRVLPTKKIQEFQYSNLYQDGKALEIAVACGPFTTSDNLSYEPLVDFLSRCVSDKKPDVIVLMGPFVDISQPLLANGDVYVDDEETNTKHQASYEMVFVEKIIRDCIKPFYNSLENSQYQAQIILIPSLLDAHHEFVFPQPPFGDRDEISTTFFEENIGSLELSEFTQGKDKRIHLLSNPCMFRINDVLFGACTNDILFSLSCEEINQNITENRIANLAGHLLRQRSFCPLFPFPVNSNAQVRLLIDKRKNGNNF